MATARAEIVTGSALQIDDISRFPRTEPLRRRVPHSRIGVVTKRVDQRGQPLVVFQFGRFDDGKAAHGGVRIGETRGESGIVGICERVEERAGVRHEAVCTERLKRTLAGA